MSKMMIIIAFFLAFSNPEELDLHLHQFCYHNGGQGLNRNEVLTKSTIRVEAKWIAYSKLQQKSNIYERENCMQKIQKNLTNPGFLDML